MPALTRVLRPSAIGGLLSLLFGITIIVSGVAAQDAGGLVAVPGCGAISQAGTTVPTCPLGTVTVTKVVVGDAPVPETGFTVEISSTNCLILSDTPVLTVFPGEPTVSFQLFQFSGTPGSGSTVPCSYALTETPVAGFTASYAPAGAFQLPQTSGTSNVDVTITNTSQVASTSPSTTSPAPTTEPATSTAPATATVAPSTSAPALANTGRSNTTPQLILGAGLCLLGLVLIIGTARRGASHS